MKYFLIGINLLFIFALLMRAILSGIFANTFNIETLVTFLLLLGLLLALYLSYRYIKSKNIVENIEKTQTILSICLISTLTFVSLGINVNYIFSLNDEGNKVLPVLEIQPFYKTVGGIIKGEIVKPSGYYVSILYQSKKERLKFEKIENYQQFVGQNTAFHIRKGILGFDVCIPSQLMIPNNQ